jgi:integrase
VKVAIAKLAPHHLRRACARSCHTARGELEQIQFLLGHVSVQTTERYLGREQRIARERRRFQLRSEASPVRPRRAGTHLV